MAPSVERLRRIGSMNKTIKGKHKAIRQQTNKQTTQRQLNCRPRDPACMHAHSADYKSCSHTALAVHFQMLAPALGPPVPMECLFVWKSCSNTKLKRCFHLQSSSWFVYIKILASTGLQVACLLGEHWDLVSFRDLNRNRHPIQWLPFTTRLDSCELFHLKWIFWLSCYVCLCPWQFQQPQVQTMCGPSNWTMAI